MKGEDMKLRHIIAATDESDSGREAVRTALDLGSRASARVSVVRVVAVEAVPRFAGVAEGTGFVSVQGDTADAVARRNRSPNLFIPELSQKIGRLLIALDASERGFRILEWACDLG